MVKKRGFTILAVILIVAAIGSVSYCLRQYKSVPEKKGQEKEEPYHFEIINVDMETIYRIGVYTKSGKLKHIYQKPDYMQKIVAVTDTDMYYATTHHNVWRVPVKEDEKVLQWEMQKKLFSETVPVERLLEISDAQCIYVTCNREIVKKTFSDGRRTVLSGEELKRAEQMLKQFSEAEYDKKLKLEEAIPTNSLLIPDDEKNPWDERDEYKNKKLQTVAKSGVVSRFVFQDTGAVSDANVNAVYTYVADWNGKLTVYDKKGKVIRKSELRDVYQIYTTDNYLYYTSGDYAESRYQVWRCPLKDGIPQEEKTTLIWNMSPSVRWKNEDDLQYLFYADDNYVVCQDEEERLYKYEIVSGEVKRPLFSPDAQANPIWDCNNHPLISEKSIYVGQRDNVYKLNMDTWTLQRLYNRNGMRFRYGQKCGDFILFLGDGEYEYNLYLLDEKRSELYKYSVWKEIDSYFKTHKIVKGELSGIQINSFHIYRNRIYLSTLISQNVPDKHEEGALTEKRTRFAFSIRLQDGKDMRMENGMTEAGRKVDKDEYGGLRDIVLLGDKFLLKGDKNFYFYSLLTGELYKKRAEECKKDADVQRSGIRPVNPNDCHDADEGEGDEFD